MKKCPTWLNWLVLIIGILYLIKDIMHWDYWWSLNPWTAVFLLIGLWGLTKHKGKK